MLLSELADELQIPYSVAKRRLNTYCRLAKVDVPRRLDDHTVSHMRASHDLMQGKRGPSIETAMEIVLGLNTPSISSEFAAELAEKIDRLLSSHEELSQRLEKQTDYLRRLLSTKTQGE